MPAGVSAAALAVPTGQSGCGVLARQPALTSKFAAHLCLEGPVLDALDMHISAAA